MECCDSLYTVKFTLTHNIVMCIISQDHSQYISLVEISRAHSTFSRFLILQTLLVHIDSYVIEKRYWLSSIHFHPSPDQLSRLLQNKSVPQHDAGTIVFHSGGGVFRIYFSTTGNYLYAGSSILIS